MLDNGHRRRCMAVTSESADARRDHAVLTELDVEYLDWLDANIRHDFGISLPALLGQPIPDVTRAHTSSTAQGPRCGASPSSM
jgi:hypothetical protein